MALVRFGGGVSELRGSVAGNVFSRSKAGAIVRNRAVPTNPNTTDQSVVRARMQAATDGFKELTKENVEEWNTFASTQERINRLGEVYTPTGKQLFTEATLNLMNANGSSDDFADLAFIELNPNLPAVGGAAHLELLVTGPALTGLNIVDADGDDNTTNLIVQTTAPMLPSFTNVKKYFRQLVVPGIGNSVNVATAYNAKYPAFAGNYDDGNVGLVIHVRVKALNIVTGLASAWVYLSIEIPAPE